MCFWFGFKLISTNKYVQYRFDSIDSVEQYALIIAFYGMNRVEQKVYL